MPTSTQINIVIDPSSTPTSTFQADIKPEIVFVSDRDGNSEIYTMTISGNNVKRLTNNSAYDIHPKWSPDKTRISYFSDSFPYVMNSDGTDQKPISNTLLIEKLPSERFDIEWAPNSQQVAVWSGLNLYILNVSDDEITYQQEVKFNELVWSPNGQQVATILSDENSSKIFITDMEKGETKQILEMRDFIQEISWSPDGEKIAISASCGMGCFAAVFTLNADGTNLLKLTDNEDPHWISNWTSDSKYILVNVPNSAYLISSDGKETIPVMDETTPAFLNSTAWYVLPVLASDEERIVFVSGRDGQFEIYTGNIGGEGLINLTQNPASDTDPDW
ncbi:MAG: PD40 domain-containing protein [Anaerolineales bacterium]|nr:PD40 domain-containing protein [Anaerolineales bacterium]